LTSFDQQIVARFRGWLGDDLYAFHHDALYCRTFRRVLRAAMGELPSLSSGDQQLRHIDALWEAFESAADGFVRGWVASHRPNGSTPEVVAPALAPASRITELVSSTMQPTVSVNEAGVAQLAALPGVGTRTASRIVARRLTKGRIDSLDQLTGIEGLGRKAREQLLPYLTLQAGEPPRALTNASLLEEQGALRFPDYVRLVHRTGLALQPQASKGSGLRQPATAASVACEELGRLVRLATRSAGEAGRRADMTNLERATKALHRTDTLQRRATSPASVPGQLTGVAPVRNSDYVDLVQHLLESARHRIYLQMFFFTSAGTNSPGDRLIAALNAAGARGADVRVILDADLEHDYHQASKVNRETAAALQQTGMALRLDLYGTTTHSKVLVVDEDQVVIGSHNWSVPSFYSRDETSLYVEGAGPAAREADWFLKLWSSYDPSPTTRTIHFDLLLFPTPAERRRLLAAGLQDSGSFLEACASDAATEKLAESSGLPKARLTAFSRLLRMMTELALPEPTAWALIAAQIETPAEFRARSLESVRDALSQLPPLAGPYLYRPVRLDALEVSHA